MSVEKELVELAGKALLLLPPGWAAQKILGPTLDYFGQEVHQFTQRRIEAFYKILRKAAIKLGSPEVLDEGAVHPRVLRDVIDEATYFEDEIAAEYFGGVLAGSRSPGGEDDRGAVWTQTLSRLSRYTIRTHYIIYTVARKVLAGSGLDFDSNPPRGDGDYELYIPMATWLKGMSLTSDELPKAGTIWADAMYALEQEGLVGAKDHGGWQLLPFSALKSKYPKVQDAGLVYRPLYKGVQLYMWAHGKPKSNVTFTDRDEEWVFEVEVEVSGNFSRTSELAEGPADA